jgi:microcystin-dependent protein
MSTCSNCYNGCTEIVSDRCVKYTGIDVPVLGIQTGDSLSFVEQALITFLVSTLDGTGIKIDLAPTVVCNLVQQYLPTCGDLTIVDISKALIQAACDLQVQVNAINATLATLNADYTIGCLTGVTASSDTHAIVQAVINKVCQLGVDLQALALDLETNYVPIVSTPGQPGINYYIQAYLNGVPGTTLINTKMVPYTPIPFYPTVTFLAGKFDGTGAGIGDWDRIFLCNGQNNTPDLRGRVLVGSNAMGANSYVTPETNPSLPGNPNYAIGTQTGTNQVQLGELQMPSHTHATTVTINDPGHFHNIDAQTFSVSSYNRPNGSGQRAGAAPPTSTNMTGLKGTIAGAQQNVFVTNAPAGGNQPHSNIQPSIGCYFIMYIPL